MIYKCPIHIRFLITSFSGKILLGAISEIWQNCNWPEKNGIWRSKFQRQKFLPILYLHFHGLFLEINSNINFIISGIYQLSARPIFSFVEVSGSAVMHGWYRALLNQSFQSCLFRITKWFLFTFLPTRNSHKDSLVCCERL